MVNKSCLCW